MPGPAVLLVISSALQRGFHLGLAAALGILVTNIIYFALSGTSLGAMLVASRWVYLTAKWLGAAWIIYMGARDLFNPPGGLSVADSPAELRTTGFVDYFRRGLVLQLSNPKAIIFFGALLPQFINANAPLPLQLLILGASSTVIEFLVLAAYSFAASGASSLVRSARYAHLTHRIGGALLIIVGLGVAFLGRD